MRPATLQTVHNRFADRPLLVFWEMTRACGLACAHCRASAQLQPMPNELTTPEGMALIDELGRTSSPSPILVLTGGDCLMREDIVALAAHAKDAGVHVAIAPSVTPRLQDDVLIELRRLGVKAASISLDGSSPDTHDGIRGIPGHYDSTVVALRQLNRLGFKLQVNTTVMSLNATELADVAAVLCETGVPIWEVFFLIGIGRGVGIAPISPRDNEDVCHFLVDAARYGLLVRTVEAPFFRRVQAQRAARPDGDPAEVFSLGPLYRQLISRLYDRLGPPRTALPLAPTVATRDGLGIIFVGYDGTVHPSGFMEVDLGNVRDSGLLTIYREHPLLKSIRQAEFPGYCGKCEFRQLCGGSRARAYVTSGDPLGDDVACLDVAIANQTATV